MRGRERSPGLAAAEAGSLHLSARLEIESFPHPDTLIATTALFQGAGAIPASSTPESLASPAVPAGIMDS